MLSVLKSYWKVFRIVFVLFSLYLMGDAFFRWDGFKHYASLYDYVASLALATVLWSIFASAAAFVIWLPFRLCERVCNRIGFQVSLHHLLMWSILCSLLGVIVWKVKTLIWLNAHSSLPLKLAVLFAVIIISGFLVWLLRNKVRNWVDVLQESITPLIWLFGICAIISVPLVAYHSSSGSKNVTTPQKITRSAVSDKKQPNILLVTFDAMSARNMSVYGYKRPTTPFIERWAKEAAVFTRAEAASNYTAPTTATLMTGKHVWTHLRYNRMQGSKPVKTDVESLPVVLKEYGYYNMMFIANVIASAENLGISGSIDVAPVALEFWDIRKLQGKFSNLLLSLFADKFRIYNWLLQEDFILGRMVRRYERDESYTRYPPELAFNSFLAHIDSIQQRPFFAWIHLDPPHYPYLPPEPFKGMFDQSTAMSTLRSQSMGKVAIQEYVLRNKFFPDDVEILRARYDEFIRYCDKQFEDFIGQLESRHMLDDTVIILSADHGESFAHNRLLHGSTLYEPETNIPLIIKAPGNRVGRVIHDVVGQKDIPATILDLTHIQVPSWMEGRSLLSLMRGDALPSRSVFSMSLEKNYRPPSPISMGKIAVWEGDYKLLHYLEKDTSLLFNIKEDPEEMNDLFRMETERGQHLRGIIIESLHMANERISSHK